MYLKQQILNGKKLLVYPTWIKTGLESINSNNADPWSLEVTRGFSTKHGFPALMHILISSKWHQKKTFGGESFEGKMKSIFFTSKWVEDVVAIIIASELLTKSSGSLVEDSPFFTWKNAALELKWTSCNFEMDAPGMERMFWACRRLTRMELIWKAKYMWTPCVRIQEHQLEENS